MEVAKPLTEGQTFFKPILTERTIRKSFFYSFKEIVSSKKRLYLGNKA